MIDLNDLRVFEHVATRRGFSEAGRALGVPRSSVSRAVARLEASVGIRLLQRTTRAVQLTAAGQALLDRCGVLLNGLDDAVAFTASLVGSPSGLLTISAGIGFGLNVLGEQLPGFLARYPDVSVSLDLSSREADLLAERVDVAIRMGPLADSAFVATRLGTMKRYVCAAPDYLERRGTPATPDDLTEHDIIDMPTASGRARSWVLSRRGESVSLDLASRVLVNDALTIARLVRHGVGIGVISGYLCAPSIADGRLLRVLPEWSPPPVDVSMIFPSSREMSPTVRAFVDYMKEANIEDEGWKADLPQSSPCPQVN